MQPQEIRKVAFDLRQIEKQLEILKDRLDSAITTVELAESKLVDNEENKHDDF